VLLKQLPIDLLSLNYTYLFELISPDYQIVIHYPHEQLILLSAYSDTGRELEYDELKTTAQELTVRLVSQRFYPNLKSLWQETRQLDASQEGFVVRWQNGVRLKLKGQEYRRIHQVLSGITPLGIWKLLKETKDLEIIRQSIPEEFWQDWDDIVNSFNEQLEQLVNEVEIYHQQYFNHSDKALGLIFNQLPDLPRKFIFARRKQGLDWHKKAKYRTQLLNFIRPEA
jgi:RNA ligase